MNALWPCPGPGGPTEEYAAISDAGRTRRLLIVPALFEEANRTRRFLIETMRLLDRAGIDSFLPDLPGCNESFRPFSAQSLGTWRAAMVAASTHFGATEVLALRGGALVAPTGLPGWLVEPVAGATLLRQLLRARAIAAREEGRHEKLETLLEEGRHKGLELAGYSVSAEMILELSDDIAAKASNLQVISQDELGDGALWLRSEPSEDPAQSRALATIIERGVRP